jgi:hypothetical protein
VTSAALLGATVSEIAPWRRLICRTFSGSL